MTDGKSIPNGPMINSPSSYSYHLSNDSQEHKAILAWTKYANVNLQIKITNQNSTYLQKLKQKSNLIKA